MTAIDTTTGVPAAWYPDPQGPPLLRWWNGAVWTAQTMDPRVAAVAPTPAARPPVESRAPGYVPMAGFSGAGATRSTFVPAPRHPGGPHTAAVWFFALYPVAQLLVGLVVGAIVHGATGAFPQFAVGGASIVFSLLLCHADNRLLKERGYRPPGWGWALLPLVYFILRVVRVGRASLGPLFAWAGFQFLVAIVVVLAVLLPLMSAAGVGAPLTATQRAAQLTPDGMATKLGADLTAADYEVSSVACPPLPSMAEGATVRCQVETPTSTLYLEVVVSPAEPGVAFVIGGGRIVEK